MTGANAEKVMSQVQCVNKSRPIIKGGQSDRSLSGSGRVGRRGRVSLRVARLAMYHAHHSLSAHTTALDLGRCRVAGLRKFT